MEFLSVLCIQLLFIHLHVLYTNIDQKLVNSLHSLIVKIGGLDGRVIMTW